MNLDSYRIASEPFYQPVADEIGVFEAAFAERLPVMLKGPTGCGKTRFVEHMAWRLAKPLVTVAAHEDMTASDLAGRYLLEPDGTVWHDGPLTMAVRHGAICYLDEIVEARQDTTVVIHPLTDARRVLPLEKHNEIVAAHADFQLTISYNPGYQSAVKDLKESTKQRFLAIDFGYPPPAIEAAIVAREAGTDAGLAKTLVAIAERSRNLQGHGLDEGASTRMLIHAGRLVRAGLPLEVGGPLKHRTADHRQSRHPRSTQRRDRGLHSVSAAVQSLRLVPLPQEGTVHRLHLLMRQRDALRPLFRVAWDDLAARFDADALEGWAAGVLALADVNAGPSCLVAFWEISRTHPTEEGITPLVMAAHTAANICRHAGAQAAAATLRSVATARRMLDTAPSVSRWWRTMDDLARRAPESVEATALRMGDILAAGNVQAFESFVAAGLKLAAGDKRDGWASSRCRMNLRDGYWSARR